MTRLLAALLVLSLVWPASAQQNVQVIGPVTPGDVPQFNSPTVVKDSTIALPVGGVSQYSYPYGSNNTNFAAGQGLTFGNFLAALNGNNVWQGTSIYPQAWTTNNALGVGAPASSIPAQSFSGKTFQLTFTSSQLPGSPIVVTYTGTGGDTQATVATGVCNAVIANTTLVSAALGTPFVCDASLGGGNFNLEWSVLIDASLTVASTGTGTVTLNISAARGNTDGIAYRFGRFIPGYIPQTGDNGVANSFWFQGGELFGFEGDISNGGSSFSSVFRLSTLDAGASNIKIDVGSGVAFRGPSSASCALEGAGSLDLCAGGLYVNTIPVALLSSSVVNGTFNGSLIVGATSAAFAAPNIVHAGTNQNLATLAKVNLATGVALSSLNDAGNVNEALEVFASNTQFSLGPVNFGLSGSNLGQAIFNNASTGTITVQAPSGSLGTVTNTLQAATDTFVYKATADTLTNKTLTSATNSLGGVTAAFGSDAKGDIYTNSGSSNVIQRLAVGTSHQFLGNSSNLPSWVQPACADISNAGTVCTASTGTSGHTVPFLDGNNIYSGAAEFTGQIFSATGTPTIASGACGATSNGAVVGGSTNQSGNITIGSAATTTCTISFSATLSATPNACIIFPTNATGAATGTTVARVSSVTNSQFVITGAVLANANYEYICL